MVVVAQARPSERAEFIRKTYMHLAGAVAAFMAVEFVLFATGINQVITQFIAGSQIGWLAMLGGFMLLGYLSSGLTAKAGDIKTQYMGLGLYVVGEAVLFAPLLTIASYMGGGVIQSAAITTLFLFAGLSAVVFTTGTDFTFLGGALKVAGMVALGLIVCSLIFGFNLGIFFSFAMVAFAAAAILYQTSQIMQRYPTDYYVAASLALFSSVMLLFWYILRIFMSRR
ncbi:MAG: permease [Phormidesmis sp. RL_2_1]|nr:permease [Phormidesmis sp. RL_2_1]